MGKINNIFSFRWMWRRNFYFSFIRILVILDKLSLFPKHVRVASIVDIQVPMMSIDAACVFAFSLQHDTFYDGKAGVHRRADHEPLRQGLPHLTDPTSHQLCVLLPLENLLWAKLRDYAISRVNTCSRVSGTWNPRSSTYKPIERQASTSRLPEPHL